MLAIDFFSFTFLFLFLRLLARTRWRSAWGSAIRGGDENSLGAALVIIYCRGRIGEGENPCFRAALTSGPLGRGRRLLRCREFIIF